MASPSAKLFKDSQPCTCGLWTIKNYRSLDRWKHEGSVFRSHRDIQVGESDSSTWPRHDVESFRSSINYISDHLKLIE